MLSSASNKDQQKSEDIDIHATSFAVAFRALQDVPSYRLRKLRPRGAEAHVCIRILFKGQANAAGDGGPYRQFFTDVADEMRMYLPFFIPVPNAFAKGASNRENCKFVVAQSRRSLEDLQMFRFLGQLMAMAIRSRVLIPLDLPSLFWKQLVSSPLALKDLYLVDEHASDFIRRIRTTTDRAEWDATAMFWNDLRFVARLSDGQEVPLTQGGEATEVTFESRLEFANLLEKARLYEGKEQISMICSGISELIPSPVLQLFTHEELEWRICGEPFIDIDLLRRHTEYASPLNEDTPVIQWFWEVLESFSQEDRSKFVEFVWGLARLPTNDEDFKRIRARLLIKPLMQNLSQEAIDRTFPDSEVCFMNITLPNYSSKDILELRLRRAIKESGGHMEDEDPSDRPASSSSASSSSAASRHMSPQRFLSSLLFRR